MTSKEENHNVINFDPEVDIIEKSNINNNDKATRIRNQEVEEGFQNPVLLRNSLSF